MHSITFVITAEKPTQEVLTKALEPFRETPDNPYGHWDWFALGGRFPCLLIPHNIANTLTGGPALEPGEAFIRRLGEEAGLQFTHTARTGSGVDAAQLGNIAGYSAILPYAVVVGGEWHEMPTHPIAPLLHKLGIDPRTRMSADELATEREMMQQWAGKVDGLLGGVCPQSWVSIVDCHI